MLGDLEVAYNVLLRQAASDYRCLLVPADHNPFSAMDYGVEAAEAAIVFDVCALAEIGNAKNNLIGVSGRVLPLIRSFKGIIPQPHQIISRDHTTSPGH